MFLQTWLKQRYPGCFELIYDNYNALAVGYGFSEGPSDVFVSFAVYAQHVNLGFHRGAEIPDPEGLLKGSGNIYRHYQIKDIKLLPLEALNELMDNAYAHSLARRKDGKAEKAGRTIIKSVAAKKRRPQ